MAGPPGGDDRFDYSARTNRPLNKKSSPDQQALGRSKGGLTTKIHVLVDALGNPVRIELSPGQAGETLYAAVLLADCKAFGVIADKAYDANWLLDGLACTGSDAVIPSKANRVEKRIIDRNLYADRNKRGRPCGGALFQQAETVSPGSNSLRKDR